MKWGTIDCRDGTKIRYPEGMPLIDIKKLRRHPQNIKAHPREQIHDLVVLIKFAGFTDPIGIDETNLMFRGHARLDVAELLGMPKVPYFSLKGKSEKDKLEYLVMDNKINESPWITENLQIILDNPEINFEEYKMKIDMSDFPRLRADDPPTSQDEIPESAASRVKQGELWELGKHRLMCGDSTLPDHKKKLIDVDEIDVMCTDPPYSSGGFQEAGKHQGSIGTRRIDETSGKEYTPKIKMDDLSTRGYTKLIRSALYSLFFHNIYIFTDWRMWDWTRETIESSGYQVRAMIVWDKLTAGLGIQWRGQHELICFGRAKETVTPAWFRGNVISAKRSGNKYHPTQKPIEVLAELIKTNLRNETVYDPFSGAGSTLITCEQLGKKCYSMEMDPTFCDIIIARWEALTNKKAKKIE